MDPEQIDKRVEWLDEQRLKDAETVRQLTTSVKSLEKAHTILSKQVQDVSEENSRLIAQSSRIHLMDEALAKHRKEVSRQLEIAESRRTEKETHQESIRKTDQKTISKQIEELKRELSQINEVKETLDVRREEQIRLNKELDALAIKHDKVVSVFQETQIQFKSLQESYQKDHKKLVEVGTEIDEVKKKAAKSRTEVEGLSDDIRRVDIRASESASADEERSQAQAVFFERLELKLVEFEKEWASWQERFAAFEADAAGMNEKIISYDETFRAARQIQDTLEGLLERLERRITEVSEMQRLAEDRLRQEWNSVQAEDHKRWNTFKLTNDEGWRDHDRLHQKLDDTLATLGKALTTAEHELTELREHDETRVREIAVLIRQWASEIERSKR